MANKFSPNSIDKSIIKGRRVAVIGYGSQGHAHALNAKDSGLDVTVGLYQGSKSWAIAEEQGLDVATTEEATEQADLIMICTADVPMAQIFGASIAPNLRQGQTLLFAHGFNIHYGLVTPPPFVDVALVAPLGPGPGLRKQYLAGSGLPCLVAVHKDVTGQALQRTLGYAWAIGCAHSDILETTLKEETETDLFGEQVVLCGGLTGLIKAAFETLVDAGYQPEIAYFVCLHEIRLIVDMLYEGGLSYMHGRISDTAEWGSYLAGPRLIGDPTRAEMQKLLQEIQSGQFAQEWIAENASGLPRLKALRQSERGLLIEKIGKELRAQMPFIDAKAVD